MESVIIFDFDHTMIECNSDPWVINKLGATETMNKLLKAHVPWTSVMDETMGELHLQGKSLSDIENSLKSIPLRPEMIGAIKSAHSMGCELRVVSDANSIFIRTVLEHYDLLQYFTEIHTNPARVDETGRLRISPFHSDTSGPHGCGRCPPNMCKGLIVENIKRGFPPGNKKRIIYLGDGRGDFCPSLKLEIVDHILAREGYPLLYFLRQYFDHVKARVHGWKDAKDVEECLGQLLRPCESKSSTS